MSNDPAQPLPLDLERAKEIASILRNRVDDDPYVEAIASDNTTLIAIADAQDFVRVPPIEGQRNYDVADAICEAGKTILALLDQLKAAELRSESFESGCTKALNERDSLKQALAASEKRAGEDAKRLNTLRQMLSASYEKAIRGMTPAQVANSNGEKLGWLSLELVDHIVNGRLAPSPTASEASEAGQEGGI